MIHIYRSSIYTCILSIWILSSFINLQNLGWPVTSTPSFYISNLPKTSQTVDLLLLVFSWCTVPTMKTSQCFHSTGAWRHTCFSLFMVKFQHSDVENEQVHVDMLFKQTPVIWWYREGMVVRKILVPKMYHGKKSQWLNFKKYKLASSITCSRYPFAMEIQKFYASWLGTCHTFTHGTTTRRGGLRVPTSTFLKCWVILQRIPCLVWNHIYRVSPQFLMMFTKQCHPNQWLDYRHKLFTLWVPLANSTLTFLTQIPIPHPTCP